MPKSNPATIFLSQCDPDFATLIEKVGVCGLDPVTTREPYEALMRSIAYQQLHGKAAQAILGRFTALFPDDPFPPPDAVVKLADETMRGCGLSGSKTAAMKGIAAAAAEGAIPSRTDAETMEDAALIAQLTSLRGVGRWTVEMLLIFTLGRPDILPVDDFGVREGYRLMKGLDAQPKPKALSAIGEAWSPYRSTAAWYLWRAVELLRA